MVKWWIDYGFPLHYVPKISLLSDKRLFLFFESVVGEEVLAGPFFANASFQFLGHVGFCVGTFVGRLRIVRLREGARVSAAVGTASAD